MKIEYGPKKHTVNLNDPSRQLGFDRASDFDWRTAIIDEDVCYDYPERRFVAVGYLDQRLHILCFTPIDGGIRVISFRKANPREARKHDKPITLIDADGEVRELTEEDFKHFRPAAEVLPELFGTELAAEMLRPKNSSVPTDNSKIFTGIHLDSDVLEAFRATGGDWQNHINDALKEWLKEHAV